MSTAEMTAAFAGLLRARRHPEQIQRAARRRALDAAAFARRAVPIYADLYGDHVFDDLSEIPFIDKAAMLSVPLEQRLAAGPPPGSRLLRTSGTTGVPFEGYYAPRFARWQGLVWLRADLERRLRPWNRRARLAAFGGGDDRHKGMLRRQLAKRHLGLPLEDPTSDLAAAVAAFRPEVFGGHPHRLLDVGRALPASVRPRVLTTHGETLEPSLRHSLVEVYDGAKVLDSYGVAEVGAVASQCHRADLYHVQQDSVVVEVLGDEGSPVGPGGTGDVVVTGLYNPLMPMVRYRMHDRATLGDRPCACGYDGQTLACVVGRSADFAVGAAGERISPERLGLYTHLDAGALFRYVRRYQVQQVASGEIEVRVELHEPLPAQVEAELLASYRAVSSGRPVSLHVRDDLGERGVGKFRLISSDLADAAGNPISSD